MLMLYIYRLAEDDKIVAASPAEAVNQVLDAAAGTFWIKSSNARLLYN